MTRKVEKLNSEARKVSKIHFAIFSAHKAAGDRALILSIEIKLRPIGWKERKYYFNLCSFLNKLPWKKKRLVKEKRGGQSG